jgi:hypothetical protein
MVDSYHGTCLRIPTRTISASTRAATTAHSSSEIRRFARASLDELISFSLYQIQNTLVIVMGLLVNASGRFISPSAGTRPPRGKLPPPNPVFSPDNECPQGRRPHARRAFFHLDHAEKIAYT